jgi:GTP-binding protein
MTEEFCRFKIYVSSERGGKGSTFAEKKLKKGGPDGGDGGRGGHVYLVKQRSLFHLKFTRHIKAGNGGDGVETEYWC